MTEQRKGLHDRLQLYPPRRLAEARFDVIATFKPIVLQKKYLTVHLDKASRNK